MDKPYRQAFSGFAEFQCNTLRNDAYLELELAHAAAAVLMIALLYRNSHRFLWTKNPCTQFKVSSRHKAEV